MKPLPKLCGADIELGNFISGLNGIGNTCYEASRAVLHEIQGISKSGLAESEVDDSRHSIWGHKSEPDDDVFEIGSQDWGRKFLPKNGGCAYIDLGHLELCSPEVVSAYDHVACWHAMLRIAEKALASANKKLHGNLKIQVLVNNSDGLGHSYGSHLNFLIARDAWENLFNRKLHHMLYLAAYQVSSLIFTGQGKVGSENGAPQIDFQISQRADFFEQLTGPQTTFDRPLVNSRDESLCGIRRHSSKKTGTEGMARLHVIFYDNTLCQVSSLLKVGVTQIILSMIEHEVINPNLLLDDPLKAVVTWSHDPSLRARAKMASGKALTAVELQLLFLEEAKRFVDSGLCSAYVPRADEILALWEDTLLKLQNADINALARRLDWVLKMTTLERVIGGHPGIGWGSPQVKHLDQIYSSLDPSEGLYWRFLQSGFVETLIDETRINWFVDNPPEDTRAWLRAMILRRASQDSVDSVDWDSVRIKTRHKGVWSRYTELEMSNPLGFSKDVCSPLLDGNLALEEMLERLTMHQDLSQDGGEEFANREVTEYLMVRGAPEGRVAK